jgi:hypothetical protein
MSDANMEIPIELQPDTNFLINKFSFTRIPDI